MKARRQSEGRADAVLVLFEGPEISGMGDETLVDTTNSFFLQEWQILSRRVSNSSESVATVKDHDSPIG